jgi:hypothetical protein
MKRVLFLALLAAPAAAYAQWEVGGQLGLRTRSESEGTLNGMQIGAIIVHNNGAQYSQTLDLLSVQMRGHTAAGGAVRENSIESVLLFRRALGGVFGASIGPAASYSLGCVSGGTNEIGYGSVPCIHDFSVSGTTRIGYAVQLDMVKANARGAAFRAGLRGTGHTVASGSASPKAAVWIGTTLPIRR